MESIPEDPSCIHFFRLLALLSHNNSVPFIQLHLKLPNSLLFGFGFKVPMLMRYSQYRLQFAPLSELDFDEAVAHLDLYTEAACGPLPRYIFKLKGEKLFANTKEELSALWKRLTKTTRDVIVQPFIISKTRKACVVKVSWHLAHGASVRLQQRSEDLDPASPDSLVTTAKEPSLPATLSQSTSHLQETVHYVRVIVEKAVCWQTDGRVRQLQIQLMRDIFDNWFLLGIETLEMCPGYLKPPYAFTSLTERAKSTVSHFTPRSVASSGTRQHCKAAPLSQKSALFCTKNESNSNLAHRMPESARQSKRKLVFVYPEEYVREQKVESEVPKLMSLNDPSKSVSSQTYKAWKKRVTGTQRMLLIDKIYARKICRARRLVQDESKATLKELQRFKETIKAKTEEMVFKAEIEDRFAGKSAGDTIDHTDLSSYTKFSKSRQVKLEQEYLMERTKENIDRVVQDSVNRMAAMAQRIREHKASLDLEDAQD